MKIAVKVSHFPSHQNYQLVLFISFALPRLVTTITVIMETSMTSRHGQDARLETVNWKSMTTCHTRPLAPSPAALHPVHERAQHHRRNKRRTAPQARATRRHVTEVRVAFGWLSVDARSGGQEHMKYHRRNESSKYCEPNRSPLG